MNIPFAVHWCKGCGVVAVTEPNTFHSSACYERWRRAESDMMDTGDAGPAGERTVGWNVSESGLFRPTHRRLK